MKILFLNSNPTNLIYYSQENQNTLRPQNMDVWASSGTFMGTYPDLKRQDSQNHTKSNIINNNQDQTWSSSNYNFFLYAGSPLKIVLQVQTSLCVSLESLEIVTQSGRKFDGISSSRSQRSFVIFVWNEIKTYLKILTTSLHTVKSGYLLEHLIEHHIKFQRNQKGTSLEHHIKHHILESSMNNLMLSDWR